MNLPEGVKPFDRSEISIGHVMVDPVAVRQIAGLEMMMGNVEIASVLAPTSTIAARLPAIRFVVCEPCSLSERGIGLMSLLESASEAEEKRKEKVDGREDREEALPRQGREPSRTED